jgi:hypothetical protein
VANTIHIIFGEAGATELRDALRQLGHDDVVLDYPDDLGFGPIAPADPMTRAKWVADTLDEPEWRNIIPHVESFWAALRGDERHVVWFSRRVTRDYTGFLEYLSRIGNRSCDVVDLTEIILPVHGVDSAIAGSRRALTVGC